MKIWIVEHHYDNGESYEDYREYMDYTVFSTYDKAMDFYCSKIIPDYEGKYILKEIEANTQRWSKLEESPYVKCSSAWDSIYDPMAEEEARKCEEIDRIESDRNQLQGMTYYPTDYWEEEYDSQQEPLSYCEEMRAEDDWLHHKGENYQVFEEIRKCEEEKILEENRKFFASIGIEVY